jgi:hypothetical protein
MLAVAALSVSHDLFPQVGGSRPDPVPPPVQFPSPVSRDVARPVENPFTTPWILVFTDSAFTVGLDTTRISRWSSSAYVVWFQTRWTQPRLGRLSTAPSPFNREVINTFLRCSPLGFKTVETTGYLDDGPRIAQTGGSLTEGVNKKWDASAVGSADEGSGTAACAIISSRGKRKPG